MAQTRPFGASNRIGTCLWCGNKLRKYRYRVGGLSDKRFGTKAHPDAQLGDYGDNVFCGLGCGYEFGLELARHGRRLEAKS